MLISLQLDYPYYQGITTQMLTICLLLWLKCKWMNSYFPWNRRDRSWDSNKLIKGTFSTLPADKLDVICLTPLHSWCAFPVEVVEPLCAALLLWPSPHPPGHFPPRNSTGHLKHASSECLEMAANYQGWTHANCTCKKQCQLYQYGRLGFAKRQIVDVWQSSHLLPWKYLSQIIHCGC